MMGELRAGAPTSRPSPPQIPQLRHSFPTQMRPRKRKREWLWLGLLGMMILAIGVTAALLIRVRVGANDAALSAMAADHLLGNALNAAVRLHLLATRPEDPAQRGAMDQAMAALSSIASEARPSVLPGYAPAGPEVDALRALIRPALGDLQRLRASPDAAGLLVPRISGLERDIQILMGRSAETVARHGARLAETSFIPFVIAALIGTTLVLVGVFVVLILRSREKLNVINQELRDWADDTANLLAAIPGVLVRSRKGADGVWRRSFVGKAVVELTGHSVEEALAYGWLRSNIPPEDLAPLFQAFDAAITGAPQSAVVRFRRKDGRIIHMRILMSHHATRNGDVEMLSLWSDVTREHDLAEHLAHTAKLAHMGELMSGLAHELNQPLTSITLAAENAMRMADRSPLDAPRLKAKLDTVVGMAARASNLVERLRDFVRVDDSPRRPLRLSAVVAAALALLANRLRLQGLTVVQRVPADLPDILGRAMPLEQALAQVISNAADAYKAQIPPCAKPELIISARVLGHQVEVTIQDRAGGIPPKILPRIFEPFFTTKPVGHGTGLGLSSTFGIIQEMEGSITADNHDGGARFTLLLPVA